jgi:hypothetical protein
VPRPKDDRRKPTDPRDLRAHARNSGHHFKLERLRGGTGGRTTTDAIEAEEARARADADAILRRAREDVANRTG